jgi:tRNA threonylcarbamoyl adenosine modification protein (Sua5/YciO/YrdC/YwlC family)
MTEIVEIHPETPQPRLIRQAVEVVRRGGLIAYPTDTTYALGCALGEKKALERVIRLRQLDARHQFTLLCADLSKLANYARVENPDFRLLKAHVPGPYTFILKATAEVPRQLQHPRKKTIGIRVSQDPVCRALLDELGEPLMTSTLHLPGDEYPLADPADVEDELGKQVDLILLGGHRDRDETTVVDLSSEQGPEVVRVGAGSIDAIY